MKKKEDRPKPLSLIDKRTIQRKREDDMMRKTSNRVNDLEKSPNV